MSLEDIFSLETESLTLKGLDTVVRFSRFKSQEGSAFLEGLELAEDLKIDTGTTLYPKGTEMTRERIYRLLRFRESNPNLEFLFKIKKTDKLINRLRRELQERLELMLKRRQSSKKFSKLTLGLTHTFSTLVDEALQEQDVVLSLYKMRFICQCAESSKAFHFVDHSLNVAIFALAIAHSKKFGTILGDEQEKVIHLLQAGLFHNYGAVLEIDRILDAPAGERLQMYLQANRQGLKKLAALELDEEVIEAVRSLCDYHDGKRDFIADVKRAALANILVVADIFLSKEAGLFGDPMDVRDLVDQMNVKVMEKQLNDLAVQALTLGLKLDDIFDFYAELERLIKKCPYDSAVPYPLTGFMSPTIFVCKKTVKKCFYLEISVKAVNLIQRLGELRAGDYHRCKLLSPQLTAFYDEHYTEIKETISEKAKSSLPKKATGGNAKKVTKPGLTEETGAKKEDEKKQAAKSPSSGTEKDALST